MYRLVLRDVDFIVVAGRTTVAWLVCVLSYAERRLCALTAWSLVWLKTWLSSWSLSESETDNEGIQVTVLY